MFVKLRPCKALIVCLFALASVTLAQEPQTDNLASVYIKKGQYEEAIEPLQKMLQVEPRNGFANHALGLAYVRTGNTTGAMQQYHILQNIDPNLAADLLAYIPK